MSNNSIHNSSKCLYTKKQIVNIFKMVFGEEIGEEIMEEFKDKFACFEKEFKRKQINLGEN